MSKIMYNFYKLFREVLPAMTPLPSTVFPQVFNTEAHPDPELLPDPSEIVGTQ